jgi:hypothetical protein
MPRIKVTDFYHAAYLVANGCDLIDSECQMFMDKAICTMTFEGSRVDELTNDYLGREAVINLYTFRQAYVRVNDYVMETKRNYERAVRSARRHGEGGPSCA